MNINKTKTMPTKYCGGCDQIRPVTQFASNSRAKDGRQYHCKSCKNEHSKIRKAATKEGTWNR
jgi:predicted SprT family Zn-dependent metalloprotease